MSYPNTLAGLARRIYTAATSRLGASVIVREINGEMFRVDRRCFLNPLADREAAAILRATVRPTDICLNIGANIGLYALQWSRWSKGTLYAFEPNPAAAQTMRRHLRLNKITSVEVIQAAVGAETGRATLYACGPDEIARLESPNPIAGDAARPISVNITTIDEFCVQRNVKPNWIVMDIEGFEIAALEGARETILTHRPRLIVEMHPAIWPSSANTTRAQAEALLSDLELKCEPIQGQRDPLGEYGQVLLSSTFPPLSN